jgi:Na+/H+-dicarboxylate symporter
MTLGTEPSGSFFSSAQLFSTIGCLIGALGGLFANWHYAKENEITYKIGKGALIGLLVGAVATIFTVIISQIWNLIDPSYQQALVDWNIQNFEAMQMPAEAKEQAIAGMEDPNSLKNIGLQALFIFIGLGIVNVISGLIGAKVFASEE